jgi:hypothetical protein
MVSEALILGDGKSLRHRRRARRETCELRDIDYASRREKRVHTEVCMSIACSVALLKYTSMKGSATDYHAPGACAQCHSALRSLFLHLHLLKFEEFRLNPRPQDSRFLYYLPFVEPAQSLKINLENAYAHCAYAQARNLRR